MHKKLLPFLFLSGISAAAFGQVAPTLTAATFNPMLNDAYISHVCDTTGVVPGAGGANVTWNFGSLVSTQVDTGRCVTVASTPGGAYIGAVSPTTTTAVETPTSGTTFYYYESATKLSMTGYYQSTTQFTYYTDPVDLLQYPVTYNKTYFDTYSGAIFLPGLSAPIKGTGTIYDTCDGWGTLKLPGSITYTNTIRIHSAQKYIDTGNLLGSGGPADSFMIETYTWYTPNYHSALLTINTTTGMGLATGINYKVVSYDSMKLSDAKVPVVSSIESSLTLFPNPVQNELNINFNAGVIGAQVRISLVDMLGREVAVIADQYADRVQHITYNTSAISKGLYLVRLQAADETVTRRIEIE